MISYYYICCRCCTAVEVGSAAEAEAESRKHFRWTGHYYIPICKEPRP